MTAAVWPAAARAVPSYARQLDMPCNGCHVQFPVLNSFGRQFKLMGYTMTSQPTISEEDAEQRKLLDLPLASLLSVMFQADLTATERAEPGHQNTNVDFPDELSMFFNGRLTPRIGSFLQLTYSGEEDKFGLDNTDIRFADKTEFLSKPLLWGFTLNNNPTVTDPWNSLPAWGYPFASSPNAPTPAATPFIETLGQQVAGSTAYGLFDDLIYGEAGVYRTAPLGVSRPLERNGTIADVAPYWRVALQHAWGDTYAMLGHFGLFAREDPDGGGPRNEFTDLGADLEVQQPIGSDVVQLLARWTYENANWGVGNAEHRFTDLNEFRLAASYYLGQHWSGTLSPFVTYGRRDRVLFAPASVSGSQTGRPDSNGLTAEVTFNPWLNIRLTLSYTAYFSFNGRNHNYDGSGRDASDNNTLFLQTWLDW